MARLISGALLMVSPTLAFWIVRSVCAVVYCVREVVFLLPTLFSFTVGEQVQMSLVAVDDVFSVPLLHVVATKKGRE